MLSNPTCSADGALSAAQRRLLLASKVEPTSAEFTETWAGRLTGPVDIERLQAAWLAVLDRHAELRLRLSDERGSVVRSSWAADQLPLLVRDVAAGDVDRELAAAVVQVIDLIDGRLVRAEVLRCGPLDHVLVISAHHCVTDDRSVQVVVDDLVAAYAGEPMAPPPPSYLDYIASEDHVGQEPDGLAAWLERLSAVDADDPIGIEPLDRDRDRTGESVRVPVPPDVWARVRASSRELRTTPHVLGLAALALTLGRYTDTDLVAIGGSMSTRSAAFADTVGMFVNPAVVPVRIDDDGSVPNYCRSVHESLLGAYRYRDMPFEEVVRRLGITPVPYRTPLFEVLFNVVGRPMEAQLAGGVHLTEIDVPELQAKYDVTLVLHDRGETAELAATYRVARYSPEAITQLTEHTATVLAGIADLSGTVGEVEMLSADERAALLATGRGETLAPDRPLVHDLVAETARAHPDLPAVTCGGVTLTYGELDARARALADALSSRGVRAGMFVGVLTEPSADMVVTVLATLGIGAGYVPLNPQHPAARLATVLDDARPALVVVDPQLANLVLGTAVLSVDDLVSVPAGATGDRAGTDDPAYVIYTSGTTNEPKGVVVPHRTLASSIRARRQVYGTEGTFLLLSPLSFDSSVAGLWGTLTTGGHLVVARADEIRDPDRTLALIERVGVTATLALPSLFAGLLTAAERRGVARLRSLTRVILAGEVLPDRLLGRALALHPDLVVVNEYGPSETTVWATYHTFDEPGPVDIGRPIPGAAVYLTDERGRLVPRGTVGHLVIGGAGVADGYLNRPGHTTRSFVADPFAGGGSRMYRSGDRARWNAAGQLQFLGRRDDMVKVRGHRIELGAVETACRACADVEEVAVVVAPGGDRLLAYLVVVPGFDHAAARDVLADLLPPVMTPALHVLPKLPRTRHGKVDRRALSALAAGAASTAAATGDPSSAETVAVIAATPVTAVRDAWCEVLAVDSVPLDANFFDVGGHSLLVLALQIAIEARTGVTLDVLDLFDAPTVNAQAALLQRPGRPERPELEADVASPDGDLRRSRLKGRRRRPGGGV